MPLTPGNVQYMAGQSVTLVVPNDARSDAHPHAQAWHKYAHSSHNLITRK